MGDVYLSKTYICKFVNIYIYIAIPEVFNITQTLSESVPKGYNTFDAYWGSKRKQEIKGPSAKVTCIEKNAEQNQSFDVKKKIVQRTLITSLVCEVPPK